MKNPILPYVFRLSHVSGQSGLSLVELLIAMALGLLLTLGVTQIYLGSSVTYRQTQGFAHAQESSRFVSAILTPALRSAGSFGCLPQANRPLDSEIDPQLNTDLNLTVPLGEALRGWEYTGTGPNDSITLAGGALATPSAGNWASGTAGTNLPASLAGRVVTNSDVVIVNAITPTPATVNAVTGTTGTSISLTGASGINVNHVVLATSDASSGACFSGGLFQNSDDAPDSSITMAGGNTPGLSYGPDTRVYEFTQMAYYIGQGTNGEPALFRRLMTPLEDPQELISGVETFQILYGIKSAGSNNAADDYVTADQVAPNDWNSVVSVRFSVMTRSPDDVLDEENDRSFNILGSEVTQASNGDRRARLVSVGTTALRRILQ
jgi:type IV pilus assembly protein PilW